MPIDREARKAKRAARRVTRRIAFEELGAAIRGEILSAALLNITGPEKMEVVVDEVVQWIDDRLELKPAGEWITDLLLRWMLAPVLRGIIHWAYTEMKEDGANI